MKLAGHVTHHNNRCKDSPKNCGRNLRVDTNNNWCMNTATTDRHSSTDTDELGPVAVAGVCSAASRVCKSTYAEKYCMQKLRVSNDGVKQCSLLLFQAKSNISLKLAYLQINH